MSHAVMRLRLHTANRAKMQSLAASGDDDLAHTAREVDDAYRGLDELLSLAGSGHEIGDVLAQVAVLARTRSVREVRALLATIALNEGGKWSMTWTPDSEREEP